MNELRVPNFLQTSSSSPVFLWLSTFSQNTSLYGHGEPRDSEIYIKDSHANIFPLAHSTEHSSRSLCFSVDFFGRPTGHFISHGAFINWAHCRGKWNEEKQPQVKYQLFFRMIMVPLRLAHPFLFWINQFCHIFSYCNWSHLSTCVCHVWVTTDINITIKRLLL